MGLFDAFVRTIINVATLPIAIVKDVTTIGGALSDQEKSYTAQKLDQIKDEAKSEE